MPITCREETQDMSANPGKPPYNSNKSHSKGSAKLVSYKKFMHPTLSPDLKRQAGTNAQLEKDISK